MRNAGTFYGLIKLISRAKSYLWEKENLEKHQSLATIFSLVAVPVVITYISSTIQRAISDQGVKKDYVVLSATVLSNKEIKENEPIKKWAHEVFAKYSPVPFPGNEQEKIIIGETLAKFATTPSAGMKLPRELMEPPKPYLRPFVEHADENAEISKQNNEKLLALQDWYKSHSESWSSIPLGLGLGQGAD